jgi:plasmid stabilization system protein ParE
VSPAATRELFKAYDWYRKRSLEAAANFLAEMDAALETIAESPYRFPSHVSGTRRFISRRFPYALIFEARESERFVIAFAHHKRRRGYWSRRKR